MKLTNTYEFDLSRDFAVRRLFVKKSVKVSLRLSLTQNGVHVGTRVRLVSVTVTQADRTEG